MFVPGMQDFLEKHRQKREGLQNAVPRRSAASREIVLLPHTSLRDFADTFRQMTQQCWGNHANIPILIAVDEATSIDGDLIEETLEQGDTKHFLKNGKLIVDIIVDAKMDGCITCLESAIAAATEGLTGAYGGSADGLVVQVFSVIASNKKKDRAKFNQYLRELDDFLKKTKVRTTSYLLSAQDVSMEQVYLAIACSILLYNTNSTLDNTVYESRFFDYSGKKNLHAVPGIRAVTTSETDIYMTGLFEVIKRCLKYFRAEADVPTESQPWDVVYQTRRRTAENAGRDLLSRLLDCGKYLPCDEEKLRNIVPGRRYPFSQLDAVFYYLTEQFYQCNASLEERAAEALPEHENLRAMCGTVRLTAVKQWLAQARQALEQFHKRDAELQLEFGLITTSELSASAGEHKKAQTILAALMEAHRNKDSAEQLIQLRDEQRAVFARAERFLTDYESFVKELETIANDLDDALRGFRDRDNIAIKAKERFVADFLPFLRRQNLTRDGITNGGLLNDILREYERSMAEELLSDSVDFFARIMQESSQNTENAAAHYLDSVLPMCRFPEIFNWGDKTEYAVLVSALENKHQGFISAIRAHKHVPYICQVGGTSLFVLLSFTSVKLDNLQIMQ